MNEAPSRKPEVVEYRIGRQGLGDAAAYDALRYTGPAQEYKQAVMAGAYRRLIGPLAGRRVLDVGCGTGRGVVEFIPEAQFAVGCDASLDMLALAVTKARGQRAGAFAAAYAQDLPFADGEFDVVTSLNFLHLFSLETQRRMISEMKRVAKPGGTLVLEFDNALQGLAIGLYKRWSGREQGLFPSEIRRVIGGDCRIVRVCGAVFPVLWRLFYRAPRWGRPIEKLAYVPPFNRLAHRVYYQLLKT